MSIAAPIVARGRAAVALAVVALAIAFIATRAHAATADRAAAGADGPLRVFILAGQSNMQGHAHVRTFDAMALSPDTAALLETMRGSDGTPTVCEQVWISSIGSAPGETTGHLTAGFGASARGEKIGPEFTFGLRMHEHLGAPILIIKTAWGGRSLHTDFRPPGAGPFEFTEAQLDAARRRDLDPERVRAEKIAATGVAYRAMIEHVRTVLSDIGRVVPGYEPARGHELAGFVWFQGWNDMVDGGVYPERARPGGYDAYGALLAQLIRDVRSDLDAPDLPFVIGVMGVGGPVESYGPGQQRHKPVHEGFRRAMAAPADLPEFAGTVVAVPTAPCWDMEVVALRAREQDAVTARADAVRRSIETGEMTRAEGEARIERLYAEAFTPRELTLLRESTSNADYHYMGSARILGRIGVAFADALVGLSTGASR